MKKLTEKREHLYAIATGVHVERGTLHGMRWTVIDTGLTMQEAKDALQRTNGSGMFSSIFEVKALPEHVGLMDSFEVLNRATGRKPKAKAPVYPWGPEYR